MQHASPRQAHLEDASAHADAVLTSRGPIELLHAAITDEGCIQGAEVIACADNGHAGDGLLLVDTWQLHVGGVVGNVHECGIHHLVVDSVLRPGTHASSTCNSISALTATIMKSLY